MSTSHKDLILDKSEVRILRSLYKGNKLLKQDVDYKFKENILSCCVIILLTIHPILNTTVFLKKGKCFYYTAEKKKSVFGSR